jgi:integrase
MVKAERRSGSYSVRVSLTDPATGKRRQKRVTARTKRELEAKVAQLKAAWHAGSYLEPSKEPFGAYLLHYLETADLAPRTRAAYGLVIRRLVAPRLGAVPLGKLTGRHVQDLYNAVRETSYAQQVQAVVSGALKLAVREGLVARNVAEGLTPGQRERGEQETPAAWTPEELATFLAAVRSHWLFPLFWTAAYTGLRLSELVALRWEDVSLDLGRLFVGTSKSQASRRRVALDGATVAVLQAHREEQARRRAALGSEWQEHGLVFDRGDGRPVSPRTVQAAMARTVRRLGLPPATPHTLRHTHATILLADGVPPHVVQQRLGHASARTTLDVYAHVLPVSEREVAERFAATLAATERDQIVTMTAAAAVISAPK